MTTTITADPTLLTLVLGKFVPDPDNARGDEPEDGLRELGESMLAVGQQQPVTVYEEGGAYHLVSGHRRLRAAGLVGMTTLLAVLVPRPAGGRRALGQAAENKARKPLSPAEDVAAVGRARRDNPGMASAEIARHIGMAAAEVSKCLAVADDPAAVSKLADGTLTSINEAYAYARADAAGRAAMLASKAAGAGSHAVIAAGKPRPAGASEGKPRRVTVAMPDATVSVTAKLETVDGLIATLAAALDLARKAKRESQTLGTAQRSWAEKAAAGKAGG